MTTESHNHLEESEDMDEKAETTKMERGAHKSKLVGASMLLLSLLLTGAVASLIYIAVGNTSSGCQTLKQQSTEVDVKATVKVKSKDGKVEEEDKIEYSRGGHQIYNYGNDGSFNFDDLRKGIHVAKSAADAVCYIIPVGGNQTHGGEVEKFLGEWDGREIDLMESEEQFQTEIYDGKVSDVSFLPQKVQDECTSGYQWMAVISKGDETAVDSAEGSELNRQKRASFKYWHWHYYYCLIGGYYYHFYTTYHYDYGCTYPYDCITYYSSC